MRFSILSILFILLSVFNFALVIVNDKTPGPDSSPKQRARLRIMGVVVLVFGIAGAGGVYWHGTRSADSTEDPLLGEYSQATSRAQSRQMGILYGKMGVMIEDLSESLKRPGTQAQIIAVVSIVIAAGCFYFSRRLHDGDETR
jgi:hypothetical protein